MGTRMTRTGRSARTVRTVLAALVLSAGTLATGPFGCQQYSTYPEIPTAEGISEDPNRPAAEAVMREAMRYIVTRYSPGMAHEGASRAEMGRVTADFPLIVNLPRGLRRSFYERIARDIGPQVEPLTEENVGAAAGATDLPIFHVGRVWLRFNTATVDIFRPTPELGLGPDGRPIYQMVTVRLEGGFKPWRVIHARAWEPGDNEPPAFNPIPAVENVEQFKMTRRAEAAAAPVEVVPGTGEAGGADPEAPDGAGGGGPG